MMCPWCYGGVHPGVSHCGHCRRPLQAPAPAPPSAPQPAAGPPSAPQPSAGQKVAAPKRSSAGWFAVVGVLLLALIGAGVFVVLRYGPSEDADDGPAAVSEARGLRDLAQKKVGAFKRTSVKTNKRTKSGVTDALKVRYKRKGGKQLSYDLFACSSPKKSKKTYSSLVKEAKKKLGKQRAVRSTADIQDEDGEKIGELTRFVSDTEIIAWYEPELAALLVGKYDDTVTFLRDCGHCPEWPEGVE